MWWKIGLVLGLLLFTAVVAGGPQAVCAKDQAKGRQQCQQLQVTEGLYKTAAPNPDHAMGSDNSRSVVFAVRGGNPLSRRRGGTALCGTLFPGLGGSMYIHNCDCHKILAAGKRRHYRDRISFGANGETESNFTGRLRDLEALKKDGLISGGEYQKKRAEIMQGKW
jgi:hypothetical protein